MKATWIISTGRKNRVDTPRLATIKATTFKYALVTIIYCQRVIHKQRQDVQVSLEDLAAVGVDINKQLEISEEQVSPYS